MSPARSIRPRDDDGARKPSTAIRSAASPAISAPRLPNMQTACISSERHSSLVSWLYGLNISAVSRHAAANTNAIQERLACRWFVVASSLSGHDASLREGFEASSSPARATITVTLSGAPRTNARPIRAGTASCGSSSAASRPISSSATCPERPSLQSRNTSPTVTGNGPSRSTSTWGCGPIERVMMFFGAASLACSRDMPPADSSSQTSE